MNGARLLLAVVSTLVQEAALVVVWYWGLPELGIFLPLYVLLVVMVVWAVYAVGVFWVVTQTIKRKAVVGLPDMVGSRGKAVNRLDPVGLVKISSELWGAESVEGGIEIGEEVTVIRQDSLKVFVRRASPGVATGKQPAPTH